MSKSETSKQQTIHHETAVCEEVAARECRTAMLYLKGISTGDMNEALSVLLGEDAKGLSANVVSRLKAQWADEYANWSRRDLTKSRYVYWWVDGIHTGLRSENSDGQCLLVIIGVRPDGRKERVAIGDGYRESKASWQELLLDLKARGLQAGLLLAVGDGAMAAA
ncbi:transposase-like protein [Paraburkholderia sp. MM6662-R1]